LAHSIAQKLAWGYETVGYFATSNAKTLVVFVHGFGGNPLGTWSGMETGVVGDPSAADCDIVFYGYGSFRAQPTASAGLLRKFLDAAGGSHQAWQRALDKASPGAPPREYDKILLVAHSLGAPITRRAVLDAITSTAPWASKVKLVLFAPAHRGSVLHERKEELGIVMGSIVATLVGLTGLRVLSIDALRPGSRFLQLLTQDTLVRLGAGWGDPVRARQVIFGEHEDIVVVEPFCEDPPAEVWPGHSHRSVCKCVDAQVAVLGHLP
jgi:pimeloyl-ACP methyl ester carboxylesterase